MTHMAREKGAYLLFAMECHEMLRDIVLLDRTVSGWCYG